MFVHTAALLVASAAGLALAEEPETQIDDRARTAELMAESERLSLLASGPTSGHDGRFFLGSEDGNFRLQIGGEIQFRQLTNFEADDNFESGFQLNRTRLEFRGHVVDPKLTYRILSNFDRGTGNLALQDSFAEYKISDAFSVRAGQFKLPFDREFYATAATATQTIERSVVSSNFRLDRSQGVQVGYTQDRYRILGAISDGQRALNTAYDSATESDIALTGRAEARFGDAKWNQFRDQTAFLGDAFGVLVGAGGHWQQEGAAGAPAGSSGTVDLFQYTADASIENNGWNALVALTGRVIEDANDSLHDLGLVAQGGYFVSENAELFARYAHIMPDSDRAGGNDDFAAITVGANWYFLPGSHAVKLSTELTVYPDAAADSATVVRTPDTGIGLLPDDENGQVSVVTQLQLIF